MPVGTADARPGKDKAARAISVPGGGMHIADMGRPQKLPRLGAVYTSGVVCSEGPTDADVRRGALRDRIRAKEARTTVGSMSG